MSEVLSPEVITDNLGTRLIGRRVLYYPQTTSTNHLAKDEARAGAPEGTVVIAGEQTLGRGRRERSWISPPGNLALSFVLYPTIKYLPSLIMVASLSTARAVTEVTGLETGIKWPNDVLINGKKVCGILVESEVRGSRVDYAVTGIGVNVNIRMADYPEVAAIATSLYDEIGREVSLVSLARALLRELDGLYQGLLAGRAVIEAWRERLVTLGREVSVVSADATYSGVAESVDRDGSLVVRRSDGSLSRVVAGDVSIR
jgi:BirA family transcriptional regulator, biotin operon repressor / biotin---[acetyl-CoA-carboxylase] ligase